MQGHWSLLVGYGCLPWVAHTVVRLRTDGTGLFALAFWTALAGVTRVPAKARGIQFRLERPP